MIYIFSFTLIYNFVRQKDKILSKKRNIAVYLLLSIIGVSLGVVYLINPYLPSVTSMIEKYLK